MTITLELSVDQERQLRDSTLNQDGNAIRQVLLQAVDAVVEKLLRQVHREPLKTDFEALADQLATNFAATASTDHKPLPDQATTREGIYGDHP